MYARIENNKVMEVIDFNPVGCFTEEVVSQFVECPNNTKQNMAYDPNANEFSEYIIPTEERLISIRLQRDNLLDEVDIKDCNAEKWELFTDEQKLLWRAYKQQLRDLPETIDLDTPVFPIKPE